MSFLFLILTSLTLWLSGERSKGLLPDGLKPVQSGSVSGYNEFIEPLWDDTECRESIDKRIASTDQANLCRTGPFVILATMILPVLSLGDEIPTIFRGFTAPLRA